jgi:anti-sigma-K factor RskA
MDVHDLTAAYALDALDANEAEVYERHLSQCEQCREQLAELSQTAGSLAFGAVAPAPPPRLRAAIVDAVRAERSNVVPLVRRRRLTRGLALAAAAAACIAVGFALSSMQSGHERLVGIVILSPNRTATLHVSGLAAAPRGKTYEAWVIPAGGKARPAGTFPGGTGGSTIRLRAAVPPRAVLAVTLERAGGVSSPTTSPILSTST